MKNFKTGKSVSLKVSIERTLTECVLQNTLCLMDVKTELICCIPVERMKFTHSTNEILNMKQNIKILRKPKQN